MTTKGLIDFGFRVGVILDFAETCEIRNSKID
jgi:hypothetical protein